MNQIASIILIVVGAVLIFFGIQAMDSFASDVSRFFQGSPTDESVWMLIGGVVCLVLGLGGAFWTRGGRRGV